MAALALPLVLGSFALSGCGGGCKKTHSSGKLEIVTTIFPVYELARRVAGTDAMVSLLVPPNQNEHHFDPTPKEVELVAHAKLGIMVGLGLDTWMEKLIKEAAPTAHTLVLGSHVKTRVLADENVGEEEAEEAEHAGEKGGDGGALHHEEHEHEHHAGAPDPHVWLDPTRAKTMVEAIEAELVAIDPAHADGYHTRAKEFRSSLDTVDQTTKDATSKWSRKGFVTFHGSFGYFAEHYGLKILAVIEPFPGSNPSAPYVEKVLSVIKEKKVPALFREPQLDPKPAEVLANAAKIQLGVLDPVGGSADTDTYEKLIQFNVRALGAVLQ
ncbi:MAG: zinc ABC transporter substrate-binding protein [Polyangiaceae bacterium]|nr:zinc ABC transporter substrate-binding protein [Polyangiaceae bacterium]